MAAMVQGSKEKNGDTESSSVSELSDDLLVEIISRVPYKSTCCCKCVSKRWRDLISHPDHRKKLPRSTLAGLFYGISNPSHNPLVYNHGYQSLAGNLCPRIDPSLSFLPESERVDLELLDCCNGLLLCQCSKHEDMHLKVLNYTVCNPITEKWVSVPATEWSSEVLEARLGFDPAISSHFHVFEFATADVVDADKWGDRRHIKAVGIYSSKTGAWNRRSAWDRPIEVRSFSAGAFFNGVMYLTSYDDMVVAAVDVEGNFRVIPIPTPHNDGAGSDVYLSRGQLYLADYGASELSIWALEDSSSENWTLKHTVSHLKLFGKEYTSRAPIYSVIIHPEQDVMFILRTISYMNGFLSTKKVVSYEMDSREQRFICYLKWNCTNPYLQYIPFFSESLADGH